MQSQSEWDISVEDLEALRRADAAFQLVDVREPHEYEMCNLGGELIPLPQLAGRIAALDRSAHIELGLARSIQHQVFGRFSGRLVLDDGESVEVDRAMGFAEKVVNAW